VEEIKEEKRLPLRSLVFCVFPSLSGIPDETNTAKISGKMMFGAAIKRGHKSFFFPLRRRKVLQDDLGVKEKGFLSAPSVNQKQLQQLPLPLVGRNRHVPKR